MAWRVGNGDNISIWQDAWVPKLENQRIQESASDYSVTKVANLIDLNLRQCKEEVITRLFSNKKAEAIMEIPLVKHLQEDRSVWSGELTGGTYYKEQL
ncbi:hypothetical protein PVK06_005794 [Gossypium arboreum]|uniref:Uncharacterized protein n=1 Tax=Gossypium arboreum TaxID=29729 RepID=A0ABR0QVI5_GOSAR|nr:hypothetical protein PVK06_005794 [Gossypium arboreum]